MNSRRIAWGVAAGVAVGSAVAALYGTKKGAELRKKIAEFTSQHAGGAGSALTGIVGSLYSAFRSTKEESNPHPENKNGHTPEEEGRKKLALPST